MSTPATKDAAARRLIDWHFQVEPYLSEVYRILVDNEDSEKEPIRLLEINSATVPTGTVETFVFAPSDEIPFAVAIAEITPEELQDLLERPETLPNGWDLTKAQRFERPHSIDAHTA